MSKYRLFTHCAHLSLIALPAVIACCIGMDVMAADSQAEIAKKLNNPIAAMISVPFQQPFLAYTTPRFTTFTINTESTYDWEAAQWSVPVNLLATQLFKVGAQPMSLQLGARYWADAPEAGAEGWGLRITYTLVLPG